MFRRIFIFCLILPGLFTAIDQPVASHRYDTHHVGLYSRKMTGMFHHWMFGLGYMHMDMRNTLDGSQSVSPTGIFNQGYRMAPLSMKTDMMMFDAMYHFTRQWAVMLMLPYTDKSMQMLTSPMMGNRQFSTHSRGIGDLSVMARYIYCPTCSFQLNSQVGLSLPTGSISQKGVTPMSNGNEVLLPYPMQLGSGTVDLLLNFSASRTVSLWVFGLGGYGIVRLGNNSHHYRFGDRFGADLSVERKLLPWFVPYAKLIEDVWGNIRGADPLLNPMMAPTADPNAQGGNRLGLVLGADLLGQGSLKGQKLNLEVNLPLYQHLDGPQLKQNWMVSLKWSAMV